MLRRTLGDTGIAVSALGLGTVQFGRQTGVRYRHPAPRPTDAAIADLLATARGLGVNLLDTAPAYGDSETRLGEALAGERDRWVICTKVGEEFDGRRSRYDFSEAHTLASVERSLRRLCTDRLDIVLVHADDRGVEAIRAAGVFRALRTLRRQGVIGALGYSNRGVADGRDALADVDVLMCTVNAHRQEELPLIAEAGAAGVGVLVKKPLASGFRPHGVLPDTLRAPGVTTVVVGTLNPAHLASHAEAISAEFAKRDARTRPAEPA